MATVTRAVSICFRVCSRGVSRKAPSSSERRVLIAAFRVLERGERVPMVAVKLMVQVEKNNTKKAPNVDDDLLVEAFDENAKAVSAFERETTYHPRGKD